MKIAVTAAGGQLGQAIIDGLLERDSELEIIGIVRSPDNYDRVSVEYRKGDYNSKEEFLEAFDGVDVALLVSGNDHPEKRIQQHQNVIDAAQEAGVKKLVYTSIVGPEEGSSFSPVVNSNRSTETYLQSSGLDWSIGRNGIYIEPDIEAVTDYSLEGKIANCAGSGKCGYTTREELGYAYAKMILQGKHNGQIYNLTGPPLTQMELTNYINDAFSLDLRYQEMSAEEYLDERTATLGDFLGPIIAGIYTGIRMGAYNVESHFETAAGRPHITWNEYFDNIKANA